MATTIDDYILKIKLNTARYIAFIKGLDKIRESFPDANIIPGKEPYTTKYISNSAVNNYIGSVHHKGAMKFALCDGVKLDNDPGVCMVFKNQIDVADFVNVIATLRSEHPEAYDALKNCIEKHSKPIFTDEIEVIMGND